VQTDNLIVHVRLSGIPRNWLDALIDRERIEVIGRNLFSASMSELGDQIVV